MTAVSEQRTKNLLESFNETRARTLELVKNLQRYYVVKQPILKKVAIEKNGYEYGFLLPCDIADNMADYYSNQLKLKI